MVHDWAKLFDGAFHDFHASWIAEIKKTLNGGLLPPGYYAAAEQIVGGPSPDVVTLDSWQPDQQGETFPDSFSGGVSVEERAPAVEYRIELERDQFIQKANRVAIRHLSGDRLVAVIEIVSAGNKSSERALSAFSRKIGALMQDHVHLLLVDLIRSGPQCPRGLPVYLDFVGFEQEPATTADKPFSLCAVRTGESYEAFIETLGPGSDLTSMPLFLNDTQYIPVPLAETYSAAWNGVPEPWKQKLTEQAV